MDSMLAHGAPDAIGLVAKMLAARALRVSNLGCLATMSESERPAAPLWGVLASTCRAVGASTRGWAIPS